MSRKLDIRAIDKSSLKIKATYFFGITVFLSSIFLSGFDDNPRKDQRNINSGLNPENSSSSSVTKFYHLTNGNLKDLPVENLTISPLKNIIKIPIERRNSNGSGTAFKIGKDVWITARHVVDGCKNLFLSDKIITRVYIPPSSDLALLVSNSFSADQFKLNWTPSDIVKSKLREDSKIGDDAYSIGFPKGQPGQAHLKFSGYVQMIQKGSYYLKEPVKRWVEVQRQPRSLDQMGGISGGPIFNKDGAVVGVHVANSVRRGRAFSVDEYAISWLIMAASNNKISDSPRIERNISQKNWSEIASSWRKKGRIRKVICTI